MKTIKFKQNLHPFINRFTSLVLFSALVVLASCKGSKSVSNNTNAQRDYKQDVTFWYQAFNTKNPQLLESILGESWQDIPTDPKNPVGKKEVGAMLVHLTTVFPDFNCEIQDILQDGNKVVVRSLITGSQKQSFMGLASKNKSMSIQAVDIHEFKDGKIVRTWHTEDWMSGLNQLGLLTR